MNKVRLALDAGFGDERALGDDFEFLFIVARLAGYRAVVERIYDRSRRDYAREDIRLLHTLSDGAGNILREEHGGIGGLEKLVNNVAARSADLDVKALELALICVKTLKSGAAVVLRGVDFFECAGEVTGSIETFFKSDVIKSSHIILLSESEHEAHCFGGCVDAEHEICVALCARLDSIRAVRCERSIADRRGVRTRIGHGDNTRELNARISAVYIHADAAELCVRACRRNGIVCADRDGHARLESACRLEREYIFTETFS